MILVLVYNYKSEKEPYVNGFVHTRIKAYQEHGLDVRVFVLNRKKAKTSYTFDGVDVTVGYKDELSDYIERNNIKTICIHFLDYKMISVLKKVRRTLDLFVFVHGAEALKWYQRLFPGIVTSFKSFMVFIAGIINNTLDMTNIRSFLKHTHHKVHLITVSEWMRDIACKNWKCKDTFEWTLIPNIVNTELFKYYKKEPEFRFRLLSVRPYFTGKYANDITAKIVMRLSELPDFEKFYIKIAGDGRLYDKITGPLKNFKNVKLQKKLFQQNELAQMYKNYGVFLCPTRQDAQGVSMCEAMASGLVPVTLCNTAIPEFLPHIQELRCNSVDDMVNLIVKLCGNKELFEKLSSECSRFIQEKCGYENTVQREIEMFCVTQGKVNENS